MDFLTQFSPLCLHKKELLNKDNTKLFKRFIFTSDSYKDSSLRWFIPTEMKLNRLMCSSKLSITKSLIISYDNIRQAKVRLKVIIIRISYFQYRTNTNTYVWNLPDYLIIIIIEKRLANQLSMFHISPCDNLA